MKMTILKRLLFAALVLPFPLALAAQEARIIRAEGKDFALTLRGVQTIITAADVPEEGINLERTGIVNTGAGTFLEIQLFPSATLIKVAENTSLVYNGIDETGKFADLGLLYGRIRLVAGGEANNAGLVAVRSGGISSRMEEGDYGIDYTLKPEASAPGSGPAAASGSPPGNLNPALRPVFRLNVFRGSADISPYGRGSQAYFGGVQKLSLGAGESLALDISSSYTFAERKPLDSDSIDYWTLHNFSGQAIPVSPPPGTAQATPVLSAQAEAGTFDLAGSADRKTAVNTSGGSKNVILALGLFLTVTSVVVQAASFHIFNAPNNDTARIIYNTGYIPLGLGVLTTLTGILYNPSSSIK